MSFCELPVTDQISQLAVQAVDLRFHRADVCLHEWERLFLDQKPSGTEVHEKREALPRGGCVEPTLFQNLLVGIENHL